MASATARPCGWRWGCTAVAGVACCWGSRHSAGLCGCRRARWAFGGLHPWVQVAAVKHLRTLAVANAAGRRLRRSRRSRSRRRWGGRAIAIGRWATGLVATTAVFGHVLGQLGLSVELRRGRASPCRARERFEVQKRRRSRPASERVSEAEGRVESPWVVVSGASWSSAVVGGWSMRRSRPDMASCRAITSLPHCIKPARKSVSSAART